MSPLKERQQSQFKKEEDMRKQIENIEAELDADKVTAGKKSSFRKGQYHGRKLSGKASELYNKFRGFI